MQIAKNSLDDALQHKDAGAGGGRRPVRILPLACKKNAKPRFLVERLVTNAKRFANLERGEALGPRDRFRTAAPARPTAIVGRRASQSTVSGLSRSGAGGRPIAVIVLSRTKLTVRDSTSPMPTRI